MVRLFWVVMGSPVGGGCQRVRHSHASVVLGLGQKAQRTAPPRSYPRQRAGVFCAQKNMQVCCPARAPVDGIREISFSFVLVVVGTYSVLHGIFYCLLASRAFTNSVDMSAGKLLRWHPSRREAGQDH
jgi:hypothetical protein